jgi:hypothetical protein
VAAYREHPWLVVVVDSAGMVAEDVADPSCLLPFVRILTRGLFLYMKNPWRVGECYSTYDVALMRSLQVQP